MDIDSDLDYDYMFVAVPVHRDILKRLQEYLESQGDTETTYSAIIANWIDKQKIADRELEK